MTRNPPVTSKAKRAVTQRESYWQHFNAGSKKCGPWFFHTVPNQRFSYGCSKKKAFVLAAQATVSLYQGPKTTREYDLEEVRPMHVDTCVYTWIHVYTVYMWIHVNTCGSIGVNEVQCPWRTFPGVSQLHRLSRVGVTQTHGSMAEYGLGLQAAQTFFTVVTATCECKQASFRPTCRTQPGPERWEYCVYDLPEKPMTNWWWPNISRHGPESHQVLNGWKLEITWL